MDRLTLRNVSVWQCSLHALLGINAHSNSGLCTSTLFKTTYNDTVVSGCWN